MRALGAVGLTLGALAAEQRAMLRIPQVSAVQVTNVTDSTLCLKAPRPVFVAMDPAKSNGHYMTLVTLDRDFEFLARGLK